MLGYNNEWETVDSIKKRPKKKYMYIFNTFLWELTFFSVFVLWHFHIDYIQWHVFPPQMEGGIFLCLQHWDKRDK